LALKYNLSELSVSAADIKLGSLTEGWQLRAIVDANRGEIGIELFSDIPILVNNAGSLVNIAFRKIESEPGKGAAVQLMSDVTVQDEKFNTLLADAMGALILGPGIREIVVQ